MLALGLSPGPEVGTLLAAMTDWWIAGGFTASRVAALAELQQRGFLNQGVSGVGTDEARSLLAQGRAAMHPIGDWLVSDAEESTVADLDAD